MTIDSSNQSPQKQIVLSFFNAIVAGDIRGTYDKYIHPDFRHHNQYYKGDRASLMAGMEENAARFPGKVFAVQHMCEEGENVWTFSKLRIQSDAPEIAVMHIFRFQDGKIIEMWDAGQEIPRESPNENGMF